MAKQKRALKGRTWFIVDDLNDNVTTNDAGDLQEGFFSEEDAINRAKEHARNEPGTKFRICKVIAVVEAPIAEPTVERTE